ncbi:MAG: hypothetical protein EBW87_00960 [Burkholderiaceae bacterium]|nr:hypothetical protein [Burkholderiaceae bacterium]
MVRLLQVAHLATAVTFGMAVSGMGEAPLRVLIFSTLAAGVLFISYTKIYSNPNLDSDKEYNFKRYSDTPIDDAVRRDLGIKD